MTIIRPSVAFKAGADWVSAEVRAYMKDQVATHVDTVTDLRDSDLERTRWVYVGAKGALYRLNLSSGAADDGDTVLRDNAGRRYEKSLAAFSTVVWDAAVDDLSARDGFDDEDAGFVILVADVGDGRAAYYVMGSGGSGDWSDAFYLTGPEGQQGDITPELEDLRDEAEEARDEARDARDAAIAAAEASGAAAFFDTYADADAALPGLSEGDIVEVIEDEEEGGANTRYRVESGVLVLKQVFGSARFVNLIDDDTFATATDENLNSAEATKAYIDARAPREPLGASRTYYVRTDGSDSNTGLANNSGGAFATIAKAIDVVWDSLDCRNRNVVIQVADGTYTTPIYREGPKLGTGRVTIRGNLTTPANVLLNVTGNGVQMYNGAWIIVEGIKIQATQRALYAAWGGVIWFQNVDFGACGSHHLRASAGFIWCLGNYTISGGAPAHYAPHAGGVVYATGVTVTLTGTPAFSTAFALVESNGALEANAMTFSGSATGPRWITRSGGAINVGAHTVDPNTYFPGSSTGNASPGAFAPNGIVNATQVYSVQRLTAILDDGVFVFNLAAISVGIVLMTIHTGSGAKTAVPVGQFRVRVGGAPFIENISLDTTGVDLIAGSALTGTTGTDGKFTISAHTDGNLYFENRTAATRQITLLII